MKIHFNMESQKTKIFSLKMGKILVLLEADSISCSWRENSGVLACVHISDSMMHVGLMSSYGRGRLEKD